MNPHPQQEEHQQGSEPTLANAAKIIAAIDAGDHGWWIGDHFIEVRNTLSALAAQVARLTEERDRLAKVAIQAVDDEPELPDDPPAEMIEQLHAAILAGDGDVIAVVLRTLVKATKHGIKDRVAAALAASPANPVTQQESE